MIAINHHVYYKKKIQYLRFVYRLNRSNKGRITITEYDLKDLWTKEEESGFKGWDFSHLNDRWESEPLPWNYLSIVKEYLKPDDALLDMGTGGGEFLLSIGHPKHNTSVTEAWEPNVEICQEKLTPLGICVKQVFDDSYLPFDDNSFDVIINKHEAYNASEVKRILKPDGVFITQQVGSKNNEILSKQLIKDFMPPYPNCYLDYDINELIKQDFKICHKNECFPYLHFFDVGAIVYFAKIIEWEFPNFSVEDCFDELYKIHESLTEKSYIESYEHRFIIVARNGQ